MAGARRDFLRAVLAAPWAAGAPPIRRQVFQRSPGKGAAVMAYAWYTRPRGGQMMSIEQRWSRSDTIDLAYYRYSRDHGRTWSAPVERVTGEKRPDGMLRRHPRGGWVDPGTGRFLEFWLEGVLPTDDPLEGLRRWRILYTVSRGDPRRHSGVREIEVPGVYPGKNSAMLGDNTSQPLALKDGRILLPVEISPLHSDGTLYNPGGGYTWHDSAVLHGRWKGDGIEWQRSELVRGDPQRSTRGAIEPTIGQLTRDRLILVLRGSNDRRPELPAYRWVSFSSDGGWNWTRPEPWTYHDGQPFFSPSACSQLLHHSNGKLYWLGNITATNPRGNRPRYPFQIGEVDQDTGRLIRDRVRLIDDLQPGEDPLLTLSNFYAREDRQTREICLHMTRLFALPGGWQGDAMLYRIGVGS